MKRLGIFVGILILSLFLPFASNAQWKYSFRGVEYNFLYRGSGILSNNYFQLADYISFHPRWVNLSAGLEIDFTGEELRRYFFEERINLNDKNSVVVRLNHLEYPDWEVGVNIVNAYFEQRLEKLIWALGLSYHSENFTKYYNDPFLFNSRIAQLRVIYSVSYGWKFYKDKIGLRIGAENFTQFENYGYDHLGPFFQISWQATKRTTLLAKADLRIVGIGVGLPHLERQTYIVGLKWVNLPK